MEKIQRERLEDLISELASSDDILAIEAAIQEIDRLKFELEEERAKKSIKYQWQVERIASNFKYLANLWVTFDKEHARRLFETCVVGCGETKKLSRRSVGPWEEMEIRTS